MSARILAIGYTPTNHDSDFLGAARAYYKEYVLRGLSAAKIGCTFSWGSLLFVIRSRQLAAVSRGAACCLMRIMAAGHGEAPAGVRRRCMEQDLRHHAKQRNQLAAPITAFACAYILSTVQCPSYPAAAALKKRKHKGRRTAEEQGGKRASAS